jgi:aspartate kinase
VESHAKCAIVSVVALDMWAVPGFLRQVLHALADAKVPVLQVADAQSSVSCLIPGGQERAAVLALHEAFELSKQGA